MPITPACLLLVPSSPSLDSGIEFQRNSHDMLTLMSNSGGYFRHYVLEAYSTVPENMSLSPYLSTMKNFR